MIRDFSDLQVWQRAIALAKVVYRLTSAMPPDERFGLTSQVRRAIVSVSSNIAEGHARQGKEFRHFLSIARGSLAEVESQLMLCVELGYIEPEPVDAIRDEAGQLHRMMNVLARSLNDQS